MGIPASSFPADTRLGVVRGLTYGVYGEPERFVPQARALGARIVRIYLYWWQVEPEDGRFDWTTVDALLGQLDDDDELWVTVSSVSPWAVREQGFLPPAAPALDMDRYRRFVRALVTRCAGRVRWWQCENEPSVYFIWDGTVTEYLTHLEAFWHVVKDVDPRALVVLGGAPPDAFRFDAPEALPVNEESVEFFEDLVRDGGVYFDVFAVHLYGDPYAVPATIDACHKLLAAHGLQKPVVMSEYNGPLPFQFKELGARVAVLLGGVQEPEPVWDSDRHLNLTASQGPDEPYMVAFYRRMASLPPKLQMFMTGCPPALAAKRDRWNCRDLVMRNVLALAAGVRRTLCWQLAPEGSGDISPYHFMELVFGKFKLMDYQDGQISRRQPAGDTFALLSQRLDGVREVRRITVAGRDELYLFEVDRAGRGPVLIVWARQDGFDGEDLPPVPFDWDWPVPEVSVVDVFGETVPAGVRDGRVWLSVTLTPVFIE